MVRPVPLLVCLALVACGASQSKTNDPSSADDREPAKEEAQTTCPTKSERTADTAYAGAKTGVTTAIAGIKTFGESAGGLVEGGRKEAKEKWKKGAKETKKTARKGKAETKKEAHKPTCD